MTAGLGIAVILTNWLTNVTGCFDTFTLNY
jgi:hypothetical protein